MSIKIALIGHSGVGKSTIFNQLTCKKKSLISNFKNTTYDRNYGYLRKNKNFILIDTGGIKKKKKEINYLINKQSFKSIKESDFIFFIVKSSEGITIDDNYIKKYLNKFNKPIFLIINEFINNKNFYYEFYKFKYKNIFLINFLKRNDINKFFKKEIFNNYKFKKNKFLKKKLKAIKISIIGKPNVGKSTLINYLLKKNRMIVFNKPGTTKDNIFTSIKYKKNKYILIDTVGINNNIKKKNLNRIIKNIKKSNVTLFMLDIKNISKKDFFLINYILKLGKPIILLINKCDLIFKKEYEYIKKKIKKKFNYIFSFYISLLKKKINISNIFNSINLVYKSSKFKKKSNKLIKEIKILIKKKPLPINTKNKIKFKYACIGGYKPIKLIIYGKNLDKINKSYIKYIKNYFHKKFKIKGIKIEICLKKN